METTTKAEVITQVVEAPKNVQYVPKNAQLARILALIDYGTETRLTNAEKEWIGSAWGRFQKSLNVEANAELTFSAPLKNGTFNVSVKGTAKEVPANAVGHLGCLAVWEDQARKLVKTTLGELPQGETKWFGVLSLPLPKLFARELEDKRNESKTVV